MAKKITITAKDVETATNKGLRELNLRRDQAEVIIRQQPSKGFLGIGAKEAVVEIKQKRWESSRDTDAQIYMDVPKKRGGRSGDRKPRKDDDVREGKESREDRGARGGKKSFGRGKGRFGKERREPREERTNIREHKEPKVNEAQLPPAEHIQNAVIPDSLQKPMQDAKTMLSKCLNYMDVKESNLNVWWDAKQERILLTFDCDSPSIVIGKDGATLEAMQYLITLSLSRQYDTNISVMADTQNYWRKIESKLEKEAERGINNIKRGMRAYRLKPMSAQMRRYIHRFLAEHAEVDTTSEGEGKWRKVVIKAKEQQSAPVTEVPVETAAEVKTVEDKGFSAAVEAVEKEISLITQAIEEDLAIIKDGIKEEGQAAVEKVKELVEKAEEAAVNAEVAQNEQPAAAVTAEHEGVTPEDVAVAEHIAPAEHAVPSEHAAPAEEKKEEAHEHTHG